MIEKRFSYFVVLFCITFIAGFATDEIQKEINENQRQLELYQQDYRYYEKIVKDPDIWFIPPDPFLTLPPLWMNRENAVKYLTWDYAISLRARGKPFNKKELAKELAKEIKGFQQASINAKHQLEKIMDIYFVDIKNLENRITELKRKVASKQKSKPQIEKEKTSQKDDSFTSKFITFKASKKDAALYGTAVGPQSKKSDKKSDKEKSYDQPPSNQKKTDKSNQKITDQEIHNIVEWGLRVNRSPEDIQNDVNSRNKTLAGSGGVLLPEPLKVVRTPHGKVTMTETEAERYKQANSLLAEISRVKERLKTLESESKKSMERQFNFVERLMGWADIYSQHMERKHLVQPFGIIDKKYGRPKRERLLSMLQTDKSIEEEIKWLASENGKKAAQEKAIVNREHHKALRSFWKNEGLPADDPRVTLMNRSVLKLNENTKEKEKLVKRFREINKKYSRQELEDDIAKLEKRAKQLP